MTDGNLSRDPALRSPARATLAHPERLLITLLLAAAGVFSAPGSLLGIGGWSLVLAAAAVARAAANLLERLPPPHAGAGVGAGLAPLLGYAAAHPDLAHPWGAVWLAAFALLWGSGADVIRSARERARAPGPAVAGDPPPRDRALDASGWLYRGAEACLIPAIARIMESVGQPLPTLPAAAAFAVWMGVVGLLQLEQRRAEEASPAFRGATATVAALVLALVLVVRALSRGGS